MKDKFMTYYCRLPGSATIYKVKAKTPDEALALASAKFGDSVIVGKLNHPLTKAEKKECGKIFRDLVGCLES